MDSRSDPAQRIPKRQASCRATTAACLRASRADGRRATDTLLNALAHPHLVGASADTLSCTHSWGQAALENSPLIADVIAGTQENPMEE